MAQRSRVRSLPLFYDGIYASYMTTRWLPASEGGYGLTLISDRADWVSPALKIRFDTSGDELKIIRSDGILFLAIKRC
jgi:hypothetical protein